MVTVLRLVGGKFIGIATTVLSLVIPLIIKFFKNVTDQGKKATYKKGQTSFKQFFKTTGVIASLGVIAFFIWRFWIRKSEWDISKADSKDWAIKAKEIAYALGTHKDQNWFQRLTENDSRAYKLLLPLAKDLTHIDKYYKKMSVDGNSILQDIYLLPTSRRDIILNRFRRATSSGTNS